MSTSKTMAIQGCDYQFAPGEKDDMAFPPLYACKFCGHLTTTPKVHRSRACESRMRHEAWKLDRKGGFHVEQDGSFWFVFGTESGVAYVPGCNSREAAEGVREAILKQAEAGE